MKRSGVFAVIAICFALLSIAAQQAPDRTMPEPGCRGTVIGAPGDGCFDWPVPRAARWVSGYLFHDRRYPLHNGIDFGLWRGGPVYAADDGVILYAGWWSARSYGYLVIVDHLNGWRTYYAHLSRIEVRQGQWVAEGAVVGRGGSTGWSTGPHLHFEMRYGGVPVEPLSRLGK